MDPPARGDGDYDRRRSHSSCIQSSGSVEEAEDCSIDPHTQKITRAAVSDDDETEEGDEGTEVSNDSDGATKRAEQQTEAVDPENPDDGNRDHHLEEDSDDFDADQQAIPRLQKKPVAWSHARCRR